MERERERERARARARTHTHTHTHKSLSTSLVCMPRRSGMRAQTQALMHTRLPTSAVLDFTVYLPIFPLLFLLLYFEKHEKAERNLGKTPLIIRH